MRKKYSYVITEEEYRNRLEEMSDEELVEQHNISLASKGITPRWI